MKKVIKRLALILVTLCLVLVGGFLFYVSDYSKADDIAQAAMQSSSAVTVTSTDDYIAFSPQKEILAGFVFYPGGKVEPQVYAQLFHQLAEEGIQTLVIKMPFNLAMFNINGAGHALETFESIDHWYLGGHSLGGVFATEYLVDHVDAFEGMVYMASYPSQDISGLDIPVLSISGTLDTVLNRTAYQEAKDKLPAESIYFDIEGGNHTNFGNYSLQSGDTASTITPQMQQEIVINYLIDFMKKPH